MCNAYHHPEGCRCGWGGEGHTGRSHGHGWSTDLAIAIHHREGAWAAWGKGHARSDLRVPLTHPLKCSICGAIIFFHTNGNGDVVFFDELGWPWPKHGCLTTEDGIRRAAGARSAVKDIYRHIAELQSRPNSILYLRDTPLSEFLSKYVGTRVSGVVMKCKTKTVLEKLPGIVQRKRIEVVSMHLHLSSSALLRIFLPEQLPPRIGDVLELVLEERSYDGRSVLVALRHSVVHPPFDFPRVSDPPILTEEARYASNDRVSTAQNNSPATVELDSRVRSLLKLFRSFEENRDLWDRDKGKRDMQLKIDAAIIAARYAEEKGDYAFAVEQWELATRLGGANTEVTRRLQWAEQILQRSTERPSDA